MGLFGGNLIVMEVIGFKGVIINCLLGIVVVLIEWLGLKGIRLFVCIDLLGVEVVEDFKKVVCEDVVVEVE